MMVDSLTKTQPRSKKARMAKTAPSPTDMGPGRHKVVHNYHDHSQVTFPLEIRVATQDGNDKRKGPRGGVTVPFPTKLHVMLSKVEERGLSHIVSWQPHGRCFVVHKPKEFVAEVMPTYFRQSKLTSFQRQLNLYGFNRITTGKDRGGYYHEFFLRHKLFLCQKMTRIRIKGTGIKGKASPETEPDFYSMPMVKPEDSRMASSRDLEFQMAAAMEEENKRSEPTKQPSRKRQDGGARKMNQAASRMSVKADCVKSESGYESPRITSLDISAPKLVTPDAATKKKLDVHSSFTIRDQRMLIDLSPPLLSPDSEDTAIQELHSGDDIIFEGKRFHYLDSFVAPPVSSHFFSLEPRRSGLMPKNSPNDIADLSFPHLTHAPPESSLPITHSLREPILTPSSSSSSLIEIFEHDDSIEINPDTIFSDRYFGDDDWAVGDAADIDAELALL